MAQRIIVLSAWIQNTKHKLCFYLRTFIVVCVFYGVVLYCLFSLLHAAKARVQVWFCYFPSRLNAHFGILHKDTRASIHTYLRYLFSLIDYMPVNQHLNCYRKNHGERLLDFYVLQKRMSICMICYNKKVPNHFPK